LPASSRKKKSAKPDNSSPPEESHLKTILDADCQLDSVKRGPFWLADPEFADYAEYPILRGAERGRFLLHAYVIMPNHVHVLLDPYVPLAKISGPIKGVSACDINSRLGRTGKPLWQDESFDHWIRNPAEFGRIRDYIESNPVTARLAPAPAAWKWSSAGNPYFKRLALASRSVH
jgi:REP element-mobilizing transposase RayT